MERYPKRKLYNNAPNSTGSGSATPPGGADGNVQYNNGGAFGGFATYNDLLAQLILSGDFIIDDSKEIDLRESSAEPLRTLKLFNDFGYGLGPYVGASGTIDRNFFALFPNADSVVTVFLLAQGIKSDGAEGISKVISASFRKDGAADPVQIGANTDLISKEDSPNTPTCTIGLGNVGTDNIRVTYDSGNIAVSYTWTFMGLVAFTKV